MRSLGRKVINLTAGELDFKTPVAVQRVVSRHLAENKYTPVAGLDRLRGLIAAYVRKEYALSGLTADGVAVTAGAKQGLAEIFQVLLNPGDEVIIPVPAWASYEQQVVLAGGKAKFVKLRTNFDLDPKAIAAVITPKTKAVVINSPHNPTGRIFSHSSLAELAGLLGKKDIRVIADEIYRPLSYVSSSPITKYFKKNLIIISGFSKSHALTGWRVGYVVADRQIISALEKLQSHTSGNVSLPSQYAALAALADPAATKKIFGSLGRRRLFVAKELAKIPKLVFTIPDGAFYFFIDISKVASDSTEFCRRLLRQELVALVPGEAFRAPGFVRLSFAAPSAQLRAGIERFKKFIAKL
ncbi:MAG: aminotransferase class I/II-fold pyridoxal phosphate-dependent enzyme [Candidatus Margulisiibacteriota bacterium]